MLLLVCFEKAASFTSGVEAREWSQASSWGFSWKLQLHFQPCCSLEQSTALPQAISSPINPSLWFLSLARVGQSVENSKQSY